MSVDKLIDKLSVGEQTVDKMMDYTTLKFPKIKNIFEKIRVDNNYKNLFISKDFYDDIKMDIVQTPTQNEIDMMHNALKFIV